jgi:thioredoxin-related protein
MNFRIFVALAFLFVTSTSVTIPETAEIKWMTWQEVQQAQIKQPRKVFVDAYTDWCGWCKRMDATTFANPEIVKYINENFYAVKFDAETKEAIQFKGKEYKFVASGYRGYNELAAQLLNGQLSYPTSVYLDEKLDVIFPVPGYQDAKTFEGVINYVNSNSYKSTSFDNFQAKFKGKVE